MPTTIDRAFLRIAAGQVHYRVSGASAGGPNLPLYLAHSGPGSSRGLCPLIAALAGARRVVAPDMLGNGDSDPPGRDPTDMAFYRDCAIEIMDGLGLDRIDFYGAHTGAQLGFELALAHPDRVRRLVLDGMPLFPPDLKAELLSRYAPEVAPDAFGGQLAWAWTFVRDQALHFPYYRRDPQHRLEGLEIPSPAALHEATVDVLRALRTYHLAYRAAFAQEVAVRAHLIATPVLVMCVEGDPLGAYLEEVAQLIPGAITRRVAREHRAETIQAFLDA